MGFNFAHVSAHESVVKVNNFNIYCLLRYITSTHILASKPDVLWDICKRSIVINGLLAAVLEWNKTGAI